MEVSSRPLTSWSDLRKFYTTVTRHYDTQPVMAFSTEVCGTGGHVHVSVGNSRDAVSIKRYMLNHPEVMMAFAHPSDEKHRLQNANNRRHWLYDHKDFVQGESKRFAITYRSDYGTVEFRLFDVAQTWEMQEEHVAFAQAFVRRAVDMRLSHRELMSRQDVQDLTAADCRARFKQLVQRLDLPWDRYRWYTQNIDARFKFKTRLKFD